MARNTTSRRAAGIITHALIATAVATMARHRRRSCEVEQYNTWTRCMGEGIS